MTPAELLTTKQAAEHLGVNRKTLYRWMQQGRIKPAWQAPGDTGAYMWNPTDLDELAEASS